MGIKDTLKKLETQIEKKRKDIEKISNKIYEFEEKKKEKLEELEKIESKYYKEALKLNNMTFNDFKELITNQN